VARTARAPLLWSLFLNYMQMHARAPLRLPSTHPPIAALTCCKCLPSTEVYVVTNRCHRVARSGTRQRARDVQCRPLHRDGRESEQFPSNFVSDCRPSKEVYVGTNRCHRMAPSRTRQCARNVQCRPLHRDGRISEQLPRMACILACTLRQRASSTGWPAPLLRELLAEELPARATHTTTCPSTPHH